jgi:gliding motility-associated-like protein
LTYSWAGTSGGTGGSGNQTGSQSGIAGTSSVLNLGSGTYTVTVTDASGCTAIATAGVGTYPQPVLSVVPVSDTLVNAGAKVYLFVSVSSDEEKMNYSWSPGAGMNNPNIYNPIADPTQNTTYTIVVSDANSCTAKDSVRIRIKEPIPCDSSVIANSVFIPKAFSPNGDGQNDILYMRIAEITCIQSLTLKIFDRWGELIFQTSSANVGWDGSYRGQPMNVGVYVYYLKTTFTTGKAVERKGNVSLVN